MGKNFKTLEAGGYYKDYYGLVRGPMVSDGRLFGEEADKKMFYTDRGVFGHIRSSGYCLVERVNADGSPYNDGNKPECEREVTDHVARVKAAVKELNAALAELPVDVKVAIDYDDILTKTLSGDVVETRTVTAKITKVVEL